MYTIVQIGAAQFKVSQGDVIHVERLENEKGKSLTLDKVLVYADGSDVRIGQPFIKDIKVKAKVLNQMLGMKTLAFQYRRCKNSARRVGYRQKLTALSITDIVAN